MAKKILDELKWHPKKNLKNVYIVYLHRGVPGNRIIVPAENIKLEKSFFVLENKEGTSTRIPYHRILEIRKGEEIIWRRRKT